MIYITGDTHIPIDINKLSVSNFSEQKLLTKNDYVIICGDFGGVWNKSTEETYWLQWLNDKQFTILFIDGNHENFDMLNNQYPVENYLGGKVHKITTSIYHLMRGHVFIINNLKFFTMGGAVSHDKEYRKEGKSWWSQEMPFDEEYNTALKNLDEHNWKVDYIITHCAPDSIQNEINDCYEHNKLTNFLEIVKINCQYKQWYFGHYHIDKDIDEKHIAMYNNIKCIID